MRQASTLKYGLGQVRSGSDHEPAGSASAATAAAAPATTSTTTTAATAPGSAGVPAARVTGAEDPPSTARGSRRPGATPGAGTALGSRPLGVPGELRHGRFVRTPLLHEEHDRHCRSDGDHQQREPDEKFRHRRGVPRNARSGTSTAATGSATATGSAGATGSAAAAGTIATARPVAARTAATAATSVDGGAAVTTATAGPVRAPSCPRIAAVAPTAEPTVVAGTRAARRPVPGAIAGGRTGPALVDSGQHDNDSEDADNADAHDDRPDHIDHNPRHSTTLSSAPSRGSTHSSCYIAIGCPQLGGKSARACCSTRRLPLGRTLNCVRIR